MFQFRFATTTDRIMLAFAVISSTITGAVAPINTIVFSQLTQAMLYNEIKDITPPNNPVPPEFDFKEEVFKFAMRNIVIGVVLLVFSYVSTTLSNYTAHNQVRLSQQQKNNNLQFKY